MNYIFLIRMKHRQEVYKDRQKMVDKICRTFNVTSSAVPNSFDDIYSKVVDNDSGKNYIFNSKLVWRCLRLFSKLCYGLVPETISEKKVVGRSGNNLVCSTRSGIDSYFEFWKKVKDTKLSPVINLTRVSFGKIHEKDNLNIFWPNSTWTSFTQI